jgi:hypothetical protein
MEEMIWNRYVDTFSSKSEAEFVAKNLIEKDVANEP